MRRKKGGPTRRRQRRDPGSRPPAAHGTRGAPLAVGAGVARASRPRRRPTLVGVAPPSPSPRQAQPQQTPPVTPTSAAVVRVGVILVLAFIPCSRLLRLAV